VIFILAQVLTPYRLIDSLQITKLFNSLHEPGGGDTRLQTVRLGFFGVATPILVLAGAIRNWKTHDWRWILGLIVLPALFYAVVLPRAIETRMFLLLGTPALLIHGATGIVMIWEQWQSRDKGRMASGLAMLTRVASLSLGVFVLFGPVQLTMRDGPRTPFGRYWATLIWREWQQGVNDGMRDLNKVANSVPSGKTLLAISSQYNADDYFRLVLLQNGYDVLPREQADRTYPGASEVFRKGDRTVVHLRCPDPYMIMVQWFHQPPYYTEAFQVMTELSSIPPQSYESAVLLNWQQAEGFFKPVLSTQFSAQPPWETIFPETPIVPASVKATYGRMNVQPLTSEQVETLRKSAEKEVFEARKRARKWKPVTTIDAIHDTFRWRYGSAPR
jgi:succinate dehydrogenase hydrophobic anchor subunit